MEPREQLIDLENKIAKGLERAFIKMIKFKQQKNSPLIISRNGEVVEIKAENILSTLTVKK